MHVAIGRARRRVAVWPVALLAGLLGCVAQSVSHGREGARYLQRLGAASAVASGPCALHLRDPETGREYQLRGARVPHEERGAGAGPIAPGFSTVGTYVPVAIGDGMRAPPLRVECTTLRVLGPSASGGA